MYFKLRDIFTQTQISHSEIVQFQSVFSHLKCYETSRNTLDCIDFFSGAETLSKKLLELFWKGFYEH